MPSFRILARHGAICLSAALVTAMPAARAGMLPAEAAQPSPAAGQDDPDRARVLERMQALGVDSAMARSRVQSLTAEEAHDLAQRIDTAPAAGALSDRDIILILLVTLLLVVVL